MFRFAKSAIAVALLLVVACNRSSPTEPNLNSRLDGTWQGEIAAYPRGEDWCRATLELQSHGNISTGTLTSVNGISHSVTGESVYPTVHVLHISNLPQETPCSVTLNIDKASAVALEGNLTGRCPNTLLGRFRLQRVQ